MIKTLTIKKSLWGRGGGIGSGYLLKESDGTMCCLGFACKALGCSDTEIKNERTPHGLIWYPAVSDSSDTRVRKDKERQEFLKKLAPLFDKLGNHKSEVNNLIVINDDSKITEKERESKIRAGFKKLGIKVRFIK